MQKDLEGRHAPHGGHAISEGIEVGKSHRKEIRGRCSANNNHLASSERGLDNTKIIIERGRGKIHRPEGGKLEKGNRMGKRECRGKKLVAKRLCNKV